MNIFKHTSVNSKVDKYKFTISYRWFFFSWYQHEPYYSWICYINWLTDPRSRPANAGLCCKYGWETEDFYKDAPNVKSYKLLIFLGTNLRISTIFFFICNSWSIFVSFITLSYLFCIYYLHKMIWCNIFLFLVKVILGKCNKGW